MKTLWRACRPWWADSSRQCTPSTSRWLNRSLRLEDSGAIYDVIAGTFFLCAAPPDSEHFESLTEEQLTRYTERFRNPEFFVPKGAEG